MPENVFYAAVGQHMSFSPGVEPFGHQLARISSEMVRIYTTCSFTVPLPHVYPLNCIGATCFCATPERTKLSNTFGIHSIKI
ncbi:hypothetical protein BS47DRAFT_1343742 [Hydnum rufescens UP504]|uniref:Uncharacterized protein n=1 Tax=Hydnum rufescens UP504 TaxID=1448309 RepID=A0A9P6AXX8_9AGAM|nr:hypothetical protein BS47DRAFT_1343742 [Hydnum rufescens UP504]